MVAVKRHLSDMCLHPIVAWQWVEDGSVSPVRSGTLHFWVGKEQLLVKSLGRKMVWAVRYFLCVRRFQECALTQNAGHWPSIHCSLCQSLIFFSLSFLPLTLRCWLSLSLSLLVLPARFSFSLSFFPSLSRSLFRLWTRLSDHVADKSKLPILIFPEGE